MTNLNIGNSNSVINGRSPFTIEAMVNTSTNLSATGVQQEIMCTDDANGTRGFQFRINAGGQLEFNYIGGNPGSG